MEMSCNSAPLFACQAALAAAALCVSFIAFMPAHAPEPQLMLHKQEPQASPTLVWVPRQPHGVQRASPVPSCKHSRKPAQLPCLHTAPTEKHKQHPPLYGCPGSASRSLTVSRGGVSAAAVMPAQPPETTFDAETKHHKQHPPVYGCQAAQVAAEPCPAGRQSCRQQTRRPFGNELQPSTLVCMPSRASRSSTVRSAAAVMPAHAPETTADAETKHHKQHPPLYVCPGSASRSRTVTSGWVSAVATRHGRQLQQNELGTDAAVMPAHVLQTHT
jgi:hypothetical protein